MKKFQKTYKSKKTQISTFIIEGFKLIQPRLTKPKEKDDWQHPTPQPTKLETFTQHIDLQTHDIQHNESEDYTKTHLKIHNRKSRQYTSRRKPQFSV